MWTLISHTLCPPGSFSYEQTEGVPKRFGENPLLQEQGKRVADFRAGNKLPRATQAEAIADISLSPPLGARRSVAWNSIAIKRTSLPRTWRRWPCRKLAVDVLHVARR